MKKKLLKGLVVSSLLCASLLTGCSSSNDQVVIYSNADDEAVTAMKNALDKMVMRTVFISDFWNHLIAPSMDFTTSADRWGSDINSNTILSDSCPLSDGSS